MRVGERRKRDKRRKSTRHKAKSRKVIVQNNTGITSNKKGNEYLWVPNIPLDSPPEEDSDVIGFETVCVWRWVRFYLESLLLFYYSYYSSYDFLSFLILISSFISVYYHHSIVISQSLLLLSNSVFFFPWLVFFLFQSAMIKDICYPFLNYTFTKF